MQSKSKKMKKAIRENLERKKGDLAVANFCVDLTCRCRESLVRIAIFVVAELLALGFKHFGVDLADSGFAEVEAFADLLHRAAFHVITSQDRLLFFAEDALQDQFCLSIKESGVFRFRAETGRTALMGDSIEDWAGVILSNDRSETRWPFVHDWQLKNGPLPVGKRLLPKIPFFLGGEYKIENFWAGNPLEGMRLKGDLAVQTRHLPDGAKVKLKIAPKPE